jgi:hypothetical protein
MARVTPMSYRVSHLHRSILGSLIDNKPNGGLAGDDVRILDINEHIKIDITGIANNTSITSSSLKLLELSTQ